MKKVFKTLFFLFLIFGFLFWKKAFKQKFNCALLNLYERLLHAVKEIAGAVSIDDQQIY